jgi:predicted DNA-binding transcriptional regulator YafY
VSETESAVVVELFLIPTYDFVMELMAMGAEVMVIAPLSLKTEIQNRLNAALKQYGINS